jgi:hypothetical protein
MTVLLKRSLLGFSTAGGGGAAARWGFAALAF